MLRSLPPRDAVETARHFSARPDALDEWAQLTVPDDVFDRVMGATAGASKPNAVVQSMRDYVAKRQAEGVTSAVALEEWSKSRKGARRG